MNAADRELWKRIDEVAYYVWDPIGVNEHPEARDEYSGYVGRMFREIRAGSLERLLNVMEQIETDTIGLSGFGRERAEQAANLMFRWRTILDERVENA